MKIFLIVIFVLSSFRLFAVDFSVTRYGGDVQVNNKPLRPSVVLKTGDIIRAIGEKSFIQIKSNLGSVFLVRDGELKLQTFDKEKSVIDLISGKFFHFFDVRKNKSKRKFIVKTKNSTMGVRGTKYMISTSAKEDYLCVCEGKVWAKKNGEEKEFTVGSNEDLVFYNNKKKSHKQAASPQMIEMTSREFTAMGYSVK